MPRAISERQLDLLKEIDRFTRKEQYAPALQDLATALGVSKQVVAYKVGSLEQRGLVLRKPGIFRSLRLTDTGRVALKAKHAHSVVDAWTKPKPSRKR